MRNEAFQKARARVAGAKAAVIDAADEFEFAKAAYRSQQQARRRVDEIITVIHATFGGDNVIKSAAEPFALALLSALLWEQRDAARAARFVANVFPSWDLDDLMVMADNCHPMKAQDVARLLGVTLEQRQRLGLCMIGACDLSDEEYAIYRMQERRTREAVRKQRSRPRNIEQRRADEKEKSFAIKTFAEAVGISEKTVRNGLASGKLGFVDSRENGVRPIIIYTADAKIPAKRAGRKPAQPKPEKAGSLPREKRVAPRSDREKKKSDGRSATTIRLEKFKFDENVYSRLAAITEAAKSAPAAIDRVTDLAVAAFRHMSAQTTRAGDVRKNSHRRNA